MKAFKAEWSGFANKQKMTTRNGNVGRDKEVVNKTMGVLSGVQDAVYYHGIKLWVDDKGVIIRGPDLAIGTQFSMLKNLPLGVFSDLAIAAELNRTASVTNGQNLSPEQRAADKDFENRKIRFVKALVAWNQPRYKNTVS